jgi:flagellar capping protein FliD
MENGRMNGYSSVDLMTAILDVRDATAFGLTNLEARLTAKIDGVSDSLGARIDGVENSVERLRDDMNRRFDRVDDRFDRLEGRVAALEPHDHSSAS